MHHRSFASLLANASFLLVSALSLCSLRCGAQSPFYGDPPNDTHAWGIHDRNRPAPAIVTPGAQPGQAPSDAVVLFDGSSLDSWVNTDKDGRPLPAKWTLVEGGAMEVAPKTGVLRTKREFGDCQLHIEWASPSVVVGKSQGRGNSGVFLCGIYEVQVLDTYQNPSYADGQAGSAYGQNPPQVNVCRPPGEWQVYDIVFHAPRFDDKGQVSSPGSLTVFQNGVLVQDNWRYEGETLHRSRAKFTPHAPRGPILLQDHGNPVRFRNIWIREIPERHTPTVAETAATRKATAASLRAASEAEKVPARRLELAMESLTYVSDAKALETVRALVPARLTEFTSLTPEALKAREWEAKDFLRALRYLQSNQLAPADALPIDPLLAALAKAGVDTK